MCNDQSKKMRVMQGGGACLDSKSRSPSLRDLLKFAYGINFVKLRRLLLGYCDGSYQSIRRRVYPHQFLRSA